MGKHKNLSQEKVLLKFMEDHLDLAKGFVKGDKSVTDDLWNNLTRLLNAEGPPIQDISGWKKVWLDWKLNIKKKLADNKKEIKATGGGPNNSQHISAIADTIAKITGIYSVVEGIPGTSAFGKSISENTTDATENANRDNTFVSSPSTSHTVKPPKPLRTNVERGDKHLNHYMDIQEVTLKGISKNLSESVELGKEIK